VPNHKPQRNNALSLLPLVCSMVTCRHRWALFRYFAVCMWPRCAFAWCSSHFVSQQQQRIRALLTSRFMSPHTDQAPMSSKLVVVLAGPTAVGKSDVATKLCSDNGGIIVSADSVQAYRGVSIGANKPDKAELERTPHILVDVADHSDNYNAAEWRRDALFAIKRLLNEKDAFEDDDEEEMTAEATTRQKEVQASIDQGRQLRGCASDQSILPVVVGGTMMYLQWLVHGRPDALRPSEEALRTANETINQYQTKEDWDGAVEYVGSMGARFAHRITTLCGRDWYRLRRLLEVAYTVKEKDDDSLIEKLYSGQREGSLLSLGYDLRCFFLCPDDRMQHTKVVDKRCEEMIVRGLLQETTDLVLSGCLPDMASKAIGYRQTLEYLRRADAKDDDEDAFQHYLDQFTTATRRYAKKQMQWFRRDDQFVFVSVPLSKSKEDRVDGAAKEIERLVALSREEYDHERLSKDSTSAITRTTNEKQGNKMKFYQFERHILKTGSPELGRALKLADECTNRLKAKKARRAEEAACST